MSEQRVSVFTKLWNISELAAYLAVPKSWVYDRTQGGAINRIPHYKMGKYLRFDPGSEEFRDWLKRNFRMAA